MNRWKWNPVPLRQPHPPSFLSDLPWPQRIAEVLRYGLLAFEYSLSPGGGLRVGAGANLLSFGRFQNVDGIEAGLGWFQR